MRGGAVTLASQAVSTVVHLASTVILARMLTPADYGVIAMVTAITSFAGLFRDLGLSSAAIQKKDLTSGQQTNLFWLNVAMGSASTIIVATWSPLVSWFYGKPELTAVTIALSFNFLIGSFGAQHGAMLVRNMQFGRKAVAGIAAGVASLVVAVAMASNGYSYWALVTSSLTGNVVGTVLLFLLSPFWPGLPRRGRGIRQMVTFGAHVTTFELVNYFHRNLDNILIGRFWGVEPLGVYSRAYALLMFPINAIRGPIYSVAFPAMSKLQADPKGFADFYRKTVTTVAAMSMPISGFAFIESAGLIELILGTAWLEASPIFSVLAFAALIQPASSLRGLVLMSLGKTKRYAMWGAMNAIVVSGAFMVGVYWGPLGVALAYAISLYVILHPSLVYVFQDTPLSPGDFYKAVSCPLTATILATLLLMFLVHFLGTPSALAYALPIKITAYFAIYTATCLTLLKIAKHENFSSVRSVD